MTDESRFDELLERDWGDEWESLPPAPPLVAGRPKSAQMTLRIPGEMMMALKDVAQRRELPYHALARSWIADGLRERQRPSGSDEVAALSTPGDTQLNLKLTPELLDGLKRVSHETRRPYHRLARLWIDAGLRRELAAMSSSHPRPSLKELIVLLLDTPSPRSGDPAVRGMTRLQKLLFVIEKRLSADPARFYAYNYGPFDEQVNDAADALQVKGLLQSSSRPERALPTVSDMMASVLRRAGPREDPEIYALTAEGRTAAEALRRKDSAYARLAERIREMRQEWDRPDLVERVYEAFPEYADRSLIKDEVARRAAARRRQRRR